MNDVNQVAFTILHYKTESLTSACIKSILELETPDGFDISVVVIDNASNNGSMEILENEFFNEARVSFLRSEENLGFSRANNRAYEYARDVLSAKWIVVLNNDTVIRQKDFVAAMLSVYASGEEPFVVGPDIFVERKGVHQNPASITLPTREEVQRRQQGLIDERDGNLKGKRALRVRARNMLESNRAGVWLLERARRHYVATAEWKTSRQNCVLHGAAYIFTEKFVETGELPFEPTTFLYHEEEILAVRCMNNNWLTRYDCRLQVIHYDDGSTETEFGVNERKRRFVQSNQIKSAQVLLDFFDAIAKDGTVGKA